MLIFWATLISGHMFSVFWELLRPVEPCRLQGMPWKEQRWPKGQVPKDQSTHPCSPAPVLCHTYSTSANALSTCIFNSTQLSYWNPLSKSKNSVSLGTHMNTRLHRLGKVLLPLSHCSKLPLSSVQDPIQKGLLVHLTLQVFLLPFLAGFLLPQPGPLFSWPSLSARQEKKTRIFSSSKQQTQEKNYDVCLPQGYSVL